MLVAFAVLCAMLQPQERSLAACGPRAVSLGHPRAQNAPQGLPWAVEPTSLGSPLGRAREDSGPQLCQGACMEELAQLRMERDELERRLVELEHAVEKKRLPLVAVDGAGLQDAVADLTASVEGVLARLRIVNAKLAELRGHEFVG